MVGVMPCYDDRADDDRRAAMARLDRVTDMLCRLGRAAYAGNPVPADAIAWWTEHRCVDETAGRAWPKGVGK